MRSLSGPGAFSKPALNERSYFILATWCTLMIQWHMLACIIILILVGSMFQHTQTVRSESECKYGELCTVFGQMCQILCVLGQVRVTEKTPTPFPPLSNTNPASTPSTRVTPTVSPPNSSSSSGASSWQPAPFNSLLHYWAWLITGAQLQLWPPHLPPHWWDCPIWDLIIGASSLCCFMPKRHSCSE